MAHLLLVLLGLVHHVWGSSTSSSCPPTDGTTRSVWSILGSCALTLLICVWHALHPDVPKRGRKRYEIALKRLGMVLLSFFVPEAVARSSEEWCKAHCQVREFREKGYEWSMTHSHFARMYGFVYRDDKGSLSMINSDKFLQLCKEGKIANPLITEREIKDKSKSDAFGKAIFTIQLFWFMLQVVVRGLKRLAVTLVELDTVCMAVLTLVYLFFWWDKPLRADCPHVFWWAPEGKVYSPTELSNAWKSEPNEWYTFITRLCCIPRAQSIVDREKTTTTEVADLPRPSRLTTMLESLDSDAVLLLSLFITWLILGALHLVAWNFEFPSEIERTMWRVSSLVLAGSSPAMLVVVMIAAMGKEMEWQFMESVGDIAMIFVGFLGVVSRVLLVGLMLASLRALPCSAHDTVSWTAYIPHL